MTSPRFAGSLQGRKLYDNLLKYVRFMLVALVTYVLTFLIAHTGSHVPGLANQ